MSGRDKRVALVASTHADKNSLQRCRRPASNIVFLVTNLSVNSMNLNFLRFTHFVTTFVSFTANHESRILKQFSRVLGHSF